MHRHGIMLRILPALGLLAAVLVSPAHAAYVCTGNAGPADNTTPYYNGDLTDPTCDIDNVEAALGITIDESLIVGAKTESFGEPITSWAQDEFDLGTLTVPDWGDTSGRWELTGDIAPLFYVDKYGGFYDIYTFDGTGDGSALDPFSDTWDRAPGPGIATTSHLSVYGVVPVPAAVWLFGSGLLGLVAVARRRRS